MNGRLYDPVVGRFLNVDPYVKDPGNTQNYNRYSYCLNNPLKYVDLTGETQGDFWLGEDGGGSGGSGGGFLERTQRFNSNPGNINMGQGTNNPKGKGAGSAGVGENGSGDYGVYYDYFSGSYLSTSTGIDVGFSAAYNAVSPYFDKELSYSLVPYAWVKAGSSIWEPKLYRLEQTPGSGRGGQMNWELYTKIAGAVLTAEDL